MPNAKPEGRLAASLDANSLGLLHGQLTILDLGLDGLDIATIELVISCKIRSNSRRLALKMSFKRLAYMMTIVESNVLPHAELDK